MEKTKISIIVPIYNAAIYLRECIESVLKQNYKFYELILVNDGSSDESGNICDLYIIKDSRIKVIHQDNQGVTKARANGVKNAIGEFIYFLDADDTIEPDTLEVMIPLMKENVDIVVSNCKKNDILNKDDFALLLFQHELIEVWEKLYRKYLFDDFVFNTSRYFVCGEDFLMQLKLLKNIKGKVVRIKTKLYNYRNTLGSVTNTFIPTMEYELSMIQEVALVMENLPLNSKIEQAYLNFRLIYLSGMIGLKYSLDFNAPWIVRTIQESKSFHLTIKQRLTILAVKYPIYRCIFVVEKNIRKLARKLIKRK